MDKLKELHELCESIMAEICEANKKVRKEGMRDSDLDTIDKLTHSLKSIKAVIAMTEEEGEDGGTSNAGGSYRYSGNGSYRGGTYRGMYRGSYDDGSYESSGRSYRRDSRGRYSRENESFLANLEQLMDHAPDEDTRRKLQQMKERAENEILGA